MKKWLRFLVPLIVMVTAVFLWRVMHPALSDEDQILADFDALSTQVSNRSPKGVISFLSKDFQIDGMKRGDLQRQLGIGMLNYRVIDMKFSRVQVQVSGDTATTTGHYDLSLKPEYTSPANTVGSEFKLKWKREDGEWKISNADGNKLPTGLSLGD